MRLETFLAQVGNRREQKTGAISFPVYFSTAYAHPALGESTGYDYTRTANPTRDILEQSLAELEGGDSAIATSSGMAAIQTLMGLFSSGDHLLVSVDLYGGTYRLFEQVLTQYGLSFTYVDCSDLEEVKKHRKPNTQAVFVETPTNPLMRVVDLEPLTQWAKENGILTIVDNTFMTPYFQQPLRLGADVVIHSATKYLGGHNDILAGAVVVKGEKLAERIRFLHQSIGAALGPLDAWLLIRGMKTLGLRMEKHQANAIRLAEYLHRHPFVDEVFYPTLEPDSQAILDRQATGYGGMISFRLKQAEAIPNILRHLRIITFAESLGGVESLMTYPITQTHADLPEEMRKRSGVCERLLRLSVGIEHADDLIQDLEQALEKAGE